MSFPDTAESPLVAAHPEAYTSSAATKPKTRPPFRPDIEGLRGIAVLLVVLYHAAVPGFTGGYIGVDVFFVLSGYLITWLLVREVEKTGTVNLKSFYARRVRRLLPAMSVLLITVSAFLILFYAPLEQAVFAGTTFSTAAYVSNLYFAFFATDYLAGAAEANPLLHTWSLSVEEQFYMFWPLLVLGALTLFGRGTTSRRRLLWVMAGVIVASFGLTLYWQATRMGHWAFFSSPTRAWEFAIGGLGVLLPLYGSERVRTLLGWIGLGGVLAAGVVYTSATPFPGWAALLPGVGTVLALRACARADGSALTHSWLARVLAVRPLQELGRLSYSWYLWHWPVLVFAAGLQFTEIHTLPPLYRAALVLLSLGLAEASYRLVENPLRHHSWLAATPWRGLAMGATMTVLGVTLSFAWKEAAQMKEQRPDQRFYAEASKDRIPGCITTVTGIDLETCVRGDTTSAVTIVLYGDSHAHHWQSALEAIAEQNKWRLITVTKSACPVIFEPMFKESLNRMYTECDEWRARAHERIDEVNPALIVATSTTNYPFNDAEWQSGLDKAFGYLSNSGYPVLYLRDIPRPDSDVPACLARSTSLFAPDCTFELASAHRPHVYDWEQAAAARYANIEVVDLTDAICDTPVCPVERDGMVLYRDDDHMTATFAASLAPVLAPHLEAAVAKAQQIAAR